MTLRGGTIILLTGLSMGNVVAVSTDPTAPEGSEMDVPLHDAVVEEAEPAHAVLFPSFVLVITVVIYYTLSRFAKVLPYTAMCFLFGAFLGIANERLENRNILHLSIQEWWKEIDGEVLLLTFLPGLLYKDASSLNVHLFFNALSQCMVFAFPMVLAGTVLTALLLYYVFPYDWSFSLCMTAGSILSATDPVAVAALLEAVGAPPRLKVHIAGEALLNDGSAIVFFTIFGLQLYLSELNIEGLGEEIGWWEGIKQFFHMSAGAVAVGIFFALGSITLSSLLDRRLNREENVVEVAMEVSVAYLCYFVAEIAWGASGVIATLTLGVFKSYFGSAFVNDPHMRDDFLSLVEHMLNSVLFTLGGLIWGSMIANDNDEYPDIRFTARDWGFLVFLYICLTVIRIILFVGSFPITDRIGLKTCWPETLFQIHGGLRGAVGIALALSLANRVLRAEPADPKFILETNKLFSFVGGIAFMTLMINATTAGPLLHKLKLSDTSAIRESILEAVRANWKAAILEDMMRLLSSQECYSHVHFEVVQGNIPMLEGVQPNEFIQAARAFIEENKTNSDYNMETIEKRIVVYGLEHHLSAHEFSLSTVNDAPNAPDRPHTRERQRKRSLSSMGLQRAKLSLNELRRGFLELVRADYERQLKHGELTDSEFVALSLMQSLDIAVDLVSKGEPLRDWEIATGLERSYAKGVQIFSYIERTVTRLWRGEDTHSPNLSVTRIKVERALAFVHAHRKAQKQYKLEFVSENEFFHFVHSVLDESNSQISEAESYLLSHDNKDIAIVVSNKFCSILLQNAARYVERVADSGVIRETESEEMLHEVQKAIYRIKSFRGREGLGESLHYERTVASNAHNQRKLNHGVSAESIKEEDS